MDAAGTERGLFAQVTSSSLMPSSQLGPCWLHIGQFGRGLTPGMWKSIERMPYVGRRPTSGSPSLSTGLITSVA
jgi:hypothetical protein